MLIGYSEKHTERTYAQCVGGEVSTSLISFFLISSETGTEVQLERPKVEMVSHPHGPAFVA